MWTRSKQLCSQFIEYTKQCANISINQNKNTWNASPLGPLGSNILADGADPLIYQGSCHPGTESSRACGRPASISYARNFSCSLQRAGDGTAAISPARAPAIPYKLKRNYFIAYVLLSTDVYIRICFRSIRDCSSKLYTYGLWLRDSHAQIVTAVQIRPTSAADVLCKLTDSSPYLQWIPKAWHPCFHCLPHALFCI
jgi:hypothetical protein